MYLFQVFAFLNLFISWPFKIVSVLMNVHNHVHYGSPVHVLVFQNGTIHFSVIILLDHIEIVDLDLLHSIAVHF